MYDECICRYFCNLHSANIRGETGSEDDYLTAGTRFIPKNSGVVATQRRNCLWLSLIPAHNVTELGREE